MGKEAKMRSLILATVILVCGCSDGINPEPKIEVEINDNVEETVVTVYYRHHSGQNGNAYEKLKTPDQIKQYRKQVEFLLNRLDEAERRMETHEPDAK